MGKNFGKDLISWYKLNKRDLPWRNTRDPYKIWLSEVILQQTQVAQGLSYYNAFVRRFPTVQRLAMASEDEVMRTWQGLGYYSRARNLHASAKIISSHYGGKFPRRHEDMLRLKGIGAYTAAAIASFAFDLPHAVVDGNVYRVLGRVFGIDAPIDSGEGKKIFAALADSLLDKKQAALYNQAIMEFGSQHCKPVNPACDACIFNGSCAALAAGRINELPVKEKTTKVRHRHFNYLVMADKKGKIYIQKRNAGDIWQGLYEFGLLEGYKNLSAGQLFAHSKVKELCGDAFSIKHVSKPYVHVLTHQKLYTRFFVIQTKNVFPKHFVSVKAMELHKFAFPRLIGKFMQDCDLEEMF